MSEKVVINFTEQGLEDIVNQLVSVGAINEKQAAEFKKANDDYKTRQALVNSLFSTQKNVTSESAKSAKSMDEFAKATANASKNIVNSGTNAAIKKTNELIDKSTVGVKEYDASLRGLKEQYKDLVAEAIRVGENTPFGDELLKKAGELKDRIGDLQATTKAYASDTATFDAIGQGIRGIGAGFQLAQGAQALFGDGNKDLEKQLVKIQATMALVNGLTEIQNALQKESALRVGLSNAQVFIKNTLERAGVTVKTQSNIAEGTGEAIKKRVIVVQAVENALQSQSIVVRYGAAAAQWALNNAMLAFPLLAIIAGLVAVAGLFGGMSESINMAAQSQIKLNTIQKENLEIMKAQQAFLDKMSSDREASIESEIALLKAKGASTDDIRAKEKQLAESRAFNASFQKGYNTQEIADLEKNRLAVIGLTASLAALNKEKAFNDNTDAFDIQIEAIKSKLEVARELVAIGENAQQKALESTTQSQLLAIEQQNEIQKEGLAFQKDIIAAKLRFAQEGSELQLSLQLAAAKNERDTALANLKSTNESRADIEAAFLEKQRDINIAFNNKILKDKIDLNNSELLEVQKGSSKELDLKLANLEMQNQIELSNVKLTQAGKEALTKSYLANVTNMLADFARQQKENELNVEILKNEAKLAVLEKGSAQEYVLKQKYLTLQEELDIVSIDKNIQGTELGEAKKAEIKARYLKLTRDLQLQALETSLKDQEQNNSRVNSLLQRQADLEANNVNTSLQRKQQLELDAFDRKQQAADEQFDIDSERYLRGAMSEKEYYNTLAKYQDEYLLNKQEKQNAADAIELENLMRRVEMANQIATDALNAASSIIQSNLDIQLAAYNKDLEANQEAFDEKKISEDEFARNKADIEKRIRAEKKKSAQQDKDISLFQIGINTAQAAIKAFATAPNYLIGALESALVLAFGAVQYATTAARPIPEFAKGTKNAPKGWAWVGEKGPELVWMKGGEEVKTHEDSIKFARQKFTPSIRDSYSKLIDRAPIPSKQAEEAMAKIASQNSAIDINILSKLIGNEVGQHLSKLPLTMMSFDKNGFTASLIEGNNTTRFMDSRYSSN